MGETYSTKIKSKNQTRFDWLTWFVRMRWFDYLGMAFLFLRVDAT